MSNPPIVHYSMLCNPRKDGDGKVLAKELEERLKEVLSSLGTGMKLKSCRYLSDGDIKATMEVPGPLAATLTDTLYASEEELDVDIMEAGKD